MISKYYFTIIYYNLHIKYILFFVPWTLQALFFILVIKYKHLLTFSIKFDGERRKKYPYKIYASVNLQYNIFYVAMKQPRSSTSQTTTKQTKRPLLPTFRQSKTSIKIQQVSGSNKSQIYFNTKVIPLEIFAERKQGETVKITVNSSDFVIQQGSKQLKALLSISSSKDLNTSKEWIQVNLGEIFHMVKVKKIGDQNVFGICSSMVNWENSENTEKKIIFVINVKEIFRCQTRQNAQSLSLNSQTIQSDKTKQMKAFVANLMSKKLNRRSTQKQISNKFTYRKKSELFKEKEIGSENRLMHQLENPSSGHMLNGISIPRTFRKEPFEKNLKQSKVTKSQKQTSVGEQSFFINHKLQSNMTQLSSIDNENYDKKKQKFDSQPYFYQKSTVTSQFSNKNQQNSHKSISISRHQKPSIQLLCQKSENIQVLKDNSEYLSQQQVEQDIKRSALIQSSLKNEDSLCKPRKQKKVQQSSQCFESKQIQQKKLLESSGTIYQSKYE